MSENVNTAQSHRPPMLAGCAHPLAMIHIPCYMYDTSTVTLGSRTPHLPNGAFCSHPGLLWKDPTKEGPWAGRFHFPAFCHWEKAAGTSLKFSENGCKKHLFKQVFADRGHMQFVALIINSQSSKWGINGHKDLFFCSLCLLKLANTENGGTVHPLHFYRPALHIGHKWVKWTAT